jgi:hypothetical protein
MTEIQENTPPAKAKVGKLPKKNKSRLPRKVKKAQARAHNKA